MVKNSLLKRLKFNHLDQFKNFKKQNRCVNFCFSFLFFYYWFYNTRNYFTNTFRVKSKISTFIFLLFIWKLSKLSFYHFLDDNLDKTLYIKRKFKMVYFKRLQKAVKLNQKVFFSFKNLKNSTFLIKWFNNRHWRRFFLSLKQLKKIFYKRKKKLEKQKKIFYFSDLSFKKSRLPLKNTSKKNLLSAVLKPKYFFRQKNKKVLWFQFFQLFKKKFSLQRSFTKPKKTIFKNLFFWYKKRLWRFKKSHLYAEYVRTQKKYDILGIWRPKLSYKDFQKISTVKRYTFAFNYKHLKKDIFFKRCLHLNFKLVRFYGKRRFKKIKKRLFRHRYVYSRFFFNFKKKKFARFFLILKHLTLKTLQTGRFLVSSKASLFSFHFFQNLVLNQTILNSRFVERNLFAGLFFEPLNYYFFFNYYFNRVFWSNLVMDLFVYHRNYQQNNF